MHYINGKGNKSELKSNINYLTNHMKSKSCHYLFMASGVDTHTHTNTHTYLHDSDFKKPSAHWPWRATGLKIYKIQVLMFYYLKPGAL